jgi:hypothetical protein
MAIEIQLSTRGKYAGKYVTIISDEDADLAELRWSIFIDRRGRIFYAQRHGKQYGLLHRVVLARVLGRSLVRGEVVDHINGDGLDNRRTNLRIATYPENQWNSKKHIDNVTGYKGVRFQKRINRWEAKITAQGVCYFLGSFDSPEKAYEAYCAKAKELFGEFAKLE